LTDEDDCSVKDPTLFDLPNAGPGDFRCQPLNAYTCDQPISPTMGGTYTNCKERTGSYLHDTADYVNFLSTIKDPSQIVVAAIAGDSQTTLMTGPIATPFVQQLALEPSCMTTINGMPQIGRPGIRVNNFANAFGGRGLTATVCQPDYSAVLSDI